MSRFGTAKTIAATLAVAASTGFVMQYTSEAPAFADTVAVSLQTVPHAVTMVSNAAGAPVFGVRDVVTAPVNHIVNIQSVAAVDQIYAKIDVPTLGAIPATPVNDCKTQVTATPQSAAFVALLINAPCFENQGFAVEHEGLIVSAMTDRKGTATLSIPALAENAVFTITFDNIIQADATVNVPDVANYDRAILQWKTGENMRLHALEDGAAIGEPGHVWSASIHSAQDALAGQSGFAVYLGNTDVEIPYQAEVYTFPAGTTNSDGRADLQIGVSVTEANCNREIDAKTFQVRGGQPAVAIEIATRLPDCDWVGDVALLPGKFLDMTLVSSAAN